jgi:hypothetical protein
MIDKLDSTHTSMMKHLQEIIDLLPAGPERDRAQAVQDRICAKIDALPGRCAARIVGVTDPEERLRILTEEFEHVVSEIPGGKFAGN